MTTDFYQIRAHVSNFAEIVATYAKDSAASMARHRVEHNVAYGPEPGQNLDILRATDTKANAPIHIFIHGGYWRAFSKADYAFVSDTIIDAGAIAVLVDYRLMPGKRMPELVQDVRLAARWVRDNAHDIDGNADAISASGHSAGAHLAFYLQARGPHEAAFPDTHVQRLLLLSGIYDLGPIPGSFLQAELALTDKEVANWSPVGAAIPPDMRAVLAVGAKETPPFHDDARHLANRIAHTVSAPDVVTLKHEDHMTIVRSLGRTGTECADLLVKCINAAKT